MNNDKIRAFITLGLIVLLGVVLIMLPLCAIIMPAKVDVIEKMAHLEISSLTGLVGLVIGIYMKGDSK